MASAGVYTQTIDLSLYASNETETYFGVVGHFSKGPLDDTEPTLITTYTELLQYFGKPRSDGDSQAWYACREYLRRGNKLKVVRVESTATPAAASVGSIKGYDENTIYAGTGNGTSVAGAGIWDDAGGGFNAANVEPGDILYVSAGADAGYYQILTVALDTRVTVNNAGAWPSGGAAGQTYSIISGKRQSLADGATSVPTLRTFTSAAGRFTGGLTTCNVQAGDILLIDDAGTDSDNGLYIVSSVSGATTLVVNRDFPTGSLANLTYAIYTHIAGQEIGATSVPATRTLTCAGHQFVDHGVVAGDFLVVSDTGSTGDNGVYIITNVAATVLTINQNWPVGSLNNLTFRVLPASVKFTGYYKGTWGDGIELFVTSNVGSPSDSVDIEVKEDGVQVEKWFGVTYADIATDLATSSYVVPVVIAGRGGIPSDHDTDFDGGVDGNTGIVDGDYIGAAGEGLQLFASGESERVDVLAVPGIYSQAVGDALLAIAEVRQNCIALLDPPPWATVDTAIEAVQWHNGQGAFGRTASISSSFVATYWPWCKVYDEYNSIYRWIAPSGPVAGAYAYNDTVAYPWFAPAGGDRGKLLGVAGIRTTPTQGQRDYMQGGTNCVNPLVNYAGEGIMIYGQKTCYRYTTALNRLNVRRMVMWFTSNGAASLRRIVFDPNDTSTWKLVKDVLEPLGRFIKKNRGLNDYLIVCDETNNTALTQANYQLITDVYLKPTLAAEQIHLRFTLTSQDANFEELISA